MCIEDLKKKSLADTEGKSHRLLGLHESLFNGRWSGKNVQPASRVDAAWYP